jgi:hypothetical protein
VLYSRRFGENAPCNASAATCARRVSNLRAAHVWMFSCARFARLHQVRRLLCDRVYSVAHCIAIIVSDRVAGALQLIPFRM